MTPAMEQGLVFACGEDTLVGVIAGPAASARIGVLVVIGGPQYRAGSHRQFVLLSRYLAGHGIAAMRFDVRGMGDSTGAQRSFERVDEDIASAVAALRRHCPVLERIVLWGLCDGASAILLHLAGHAADAAVDGVVLANPWVRSAETESKTLLRHHYTQRLRDPAFLRRLVRGDVPVRAALVSLTRNLRNAFGRAAEGTGAQVSFQERMVRSLARYPGRVLLVLSGNDLTAQEFMMFMRSHDARRELLQRPGTTVHHVQADHTFSDRGAWHEVQRLTLEWVRSATREDNASAGRSRPAIVNAGEQR